MRGWRTKLVTTRRLQIVCLEEDTVALWVFLTLLSGLRVCTGGWAGCVPQTSEGCEVGSEVHVSGFRHGFDGFTCRKPIKA